MTHKSTAIIVFIGISVLLLGAKAATFQCQDPGLPNYVLPAYIKCDLDMRSQCGCGSWCGLGGAPNTDDKIPKCTPKIDTPDAPPPRFQGGNPCPLQDCPFAPFHVVRCPFNGSRTYTHVGASCNRVAGACVWQLPYCEPFYPPANARCPKGDAGCTAPKPAGPPATEQQIVDCGGPWWQGNYKAHYECIADGNGFCKWQWVPCPGFFTCPLGMRRFDQSQCSLDQVPNCQWKDSGCSTCDSYPTQCPKPTLQTKVYFTPEPCGGCNCRVTQDMGGTNASVCEGQTWNQPLNGFGQGILCDTGYNYQPTFPFCVPATPYPTCATLQPPCPQGQTCFEMGTYDNGIRIYKPACYPTPGVPDITLTPCSDVGCNDGFVCVTDVQGKWSCVLGTNQPACDCSTVPKVTCWNGAQVGGPGCNRRHNGQCEWDFQPCPNYTAPLTNPANGARNCQVSAWNQWSCGAPCGTWTKQTRTRNVTQVNETGGVPCPNLLEAGIDCQGSAATGCTNIPATVTITSFFTGSAVTNASIVTGDPTYSTTGSATPVPGGVTSTGATTGSVGTTSTVNVLSSTGPCCGTLSTGGPASSGQTTGPQTTTGQTSVTSGQTSQTGQTTQTTGQTSVTTGQTSQTGQTTQTTGQTSVTTGQTSQTGQTTQTTGQTSVTSGQTSQTGQTTQTTGQTSVTTGQTSQTGQTTQTTGQTSVTSGQTSQTGQTTQTTGQTSVTSGQTSQTGQTTQTGQTSQTGQNSGQPDPIGSGSAGGFPLWGWILIAIFVVLLIVICVIIIICCCVKKGAENV